MDTYAFVYKWTHLPTGRWYIGSRSAAGCHPNDGYICSSTIVKPLILQHPTDWQRTIIAMGDPVDMRLFERELLMELNAAKDPNSFNQTNGGGKSFQAKLGFPKSEATKAKMSQASKGRPKSAQHRQRMAAADRSKSKIPCKESTKQILSQKFKGRPSTRQAVWQIHYRDEVFEFKNLRQFCRQTFDVDDKHAYSVLVRGNDFNGYNAVRII